MSSVDIIIGTVSIFLKKILVTIQICLIIACGYWLIANIDWHSALQNCYTVSVIWLFIVLIHRFTPWFAVGKRLSDLLQSRISFWTGFRATILCVGCNSVLPARFGEIVKIFWLNRKSNLGISYLLGAVFLERLLDITILLLLLFCFGASHANIGITISITCGVLALWVGVLILRKYYLKISSYLKKLPIPSKIIGSILAFSDNIHTILALDLFRKLVLGTFLVWSMNWLHVYLVSNCLLNLYLTYSQIGLLCVTIFFSSALLLAPGGIGVMEVAIIFVLEMFGIERSLSATTAVFLRLFYSVPPVICAILVLIENEKTCVDICKLIFKKKLLKEYKCKIF